MYVSRIKLRRQKPFSIRLGRARAACCPVLDHVLILLRSFAFRFSNSHVYMNKEFLDGHMRGSLENITWSVMGKQTAQAKRVYFIWWNYL